MRLAIPPDGDNPIEHLRHRGAVVYATVLWLALTILAVWLIVGGDILGRIIGLVLVIVLLLSARRGLSYRTRGTRGSG